MDGTDFQLKPNDRILSLPPGGAGSIVLTIQDVRIDSTNKTTELALSETLFSIRRIHRDISTRVGAFLSLAEKAGSLPWLQRDEAKPLTDLKNGAPAANPAILPMQKWKRLSEHDERITGWTTKVQETAPDAAKAEPAKPNSPFNTLATALHTAIEGGCTNLISHLQNTCAELLLLDDTALTFYAIVKDVNEAVLTERAAAHEEVAIVGMPTVASFPEHKATLQALFDATTDAAFAKARNALTTWWGSQTTAAGLLTWFGMQPTVGALNVQAKALNGLVAKLTDALSPAASYPFTPVLQTLTEAVPGFADIHPISDCPAQERIDRLRAAIDAPVKQYAKALEAVVTLASVPTSEILKQLDNLLLEPIRINASPLERHKVRKLPGDTVHTRIVLDASLKHTYKRDTVTIYANVVNATHGETVRQVIGSGDASKAFQQFPLAKRPLTYLATATRSGVESTLAVRVNNLLRHETETLLDADENSHAVAVQADETWRSTVQFGDGATGARLPTGRENVRAVYRTGLGTQGNVKAGTITQPAHRPLGVKDVNNPLAATGGADPENVAQIRANAPLAVMALDRLVSVRDYADFAQNYAAIDKAAVKRFLFGGQGA